MKEGFSVTKNSNGSALQCLKLEPGVYTLSNPAENMSKYHIKLKDVDYVEGMAT
jgi:hypothetical protein